jgi:anti-anti-sigma regulatory factor
VRVRAGCRLLVSGYGRGAYGAAVADAGRAVDRPSWDGHLLLLHQSEGDRLVRLAEWVRHGLDGGEKVLYADGPDPAHSSILDHLRGQGIDVGAATAEGRFELLPLTAFYPSQGQGVVVDRALDEGFPAVRLSAEVAAALTVLTPQAYRDIEQNMDRLCRTRPVSALCQYGRSTTVGPVLGAAVATHPRGVRELMFDSTASPAGLVLHGEIDVDNADVLAAVLGAALAAALSSGRDGLRLDLAGLGFLDVAACRAIADTSRVFRATGRRLLLVGPPPLVAWVMGLVGLTDAPGVALVGSAR